MEKLINLKTWMLITLVIGFISCKKDAPLDTKPVAAFSVNAVELIVGNPAVFTNLSFDQNGDVKSYSWDFGDGSTSTEASPTHSFAKGKYTVTLTVTDNSGNTNKNSFSKVITVVEPSTATTEPAKVWVFNLPGKFEDSSPAIADDGTVYIGCSAKNGLANVFAVKNGMEVWSYATGDIVRSAPAIAENGNVYIGSYDNNLYGFTAAGSLSFKFDMGDNAKYSAPVLGSDGTIYIGSQKDKIHAVNPDGSKKWEYQTGGDVNATSAVGSDGTVFIGSTDGTFYAINQDGTLKWSSKFGSWTATATALGADGTVYFAGEGNNIDPASGGVLIAYNPADGTEKWRVNLTQKINQGGPSVAPDGTVYAGGADKKLVAYNPLDGSVKWVYPTNGAIQGTPAIDNDGNIYVTDMEGYLYVIDADGNKKWKETQLGSKIWSSPAIDANGVIYVAAEQSDGTGKLFALKTNATGLAATGWPMRSKNAKHTGR